MHSLYQRKDLIPSLYVKSVYGAYQVRSIFVMARNMAPCMLIMEDMETVVYGGSRSYFFNEVDGLENNNGILMLGSTNYLERLDPGITKRPSRFDRKYLFPLPTNEEREQYCRYWRKKIMKNPQVDYPKKLVRLIAAITFGFSFAYLQEAFVATLLELARQQAIDGSAIQAAIKSATLDNMEEAWGGEDDTNKSDNNDDDNDDDDDDDIEKLPFWRTIRQQVEILRDDLQRQSQASNEQEHGFFATPRKYFDAVFGGLYQGVSKYMFGALGANPDNLGSSNMTQMDHWNESKGELPGLPAVLAKGESVRGTGRATSGHLDLPALSSPRNMG